MSEVKALFPIGKTQWSKWNDPAREAFNSMRKKGFEFDVAVEEANAVQASHKKSGLLSALEDTLEGLKKVGDVAETVTDVAATVAPVVAVAKTIAKRTRTKKGK